MVPTWDHKNPTAFRTQAKEDLLSHYSTMQVAQGEVVEIQKRDDSHFELKDADGKTWASKKIILAVGTVDNFPDIGGYAENWASRM